MRASSPRALSGKPAVLARKEKPVASVNKKSKDAKSTKNTRAKSSRTHAASKKLPKRTTLEIVKAFVEEAKKHTNMILIGIDPGTTGAIAMKCHKFYCAVDIPRTESKRKKTRRTSFKERKETGRKSKTVIGTDREPDLRTIIDLFAMFDDVQDRVYVILEKIPPTIGKRGRKYAEIMLNRAYAMWPLFLTSKGYNIRQEKPSVWKESFNLLGADKDVGRVLALKFFPRADIKRKKDHDRGDALLLVEYLQRQLEKA